MTKMRPKSHHAAAAGESGQALARLTKKRSEPGLPGSPSLSETAYQALRRAIQEGVIEPNTHLAEADLSAWLQMSRTPVREAMRRLESEGVVLNHPFRGAVVVTLGEDDMRQLYAVRELLEVAAAGWCALEASASDIRAMKEIVDEESRSLRDPRALIELNRRFHQEICNGAHNHFLLRTLAAVQNAHVLLGKSNRLSEDRARASHREHRLILSAIEKHDRKAAEKAMTLHVQLALRHRLKRAGGPAASRGTDPAS